VDVLVGLGPPEDRGVVEGDLRRDVADERVVGGGLVRDRVEPFAGTGPGGLDLGGVADQRDGLRPAGGGRVASPREGLRRID